MLTSWNRRHSRYRRLVGWQWPHVNVRKTIDLSAVLIVNTRRNACEARYAVWAIAHPAIALRDADLSDHTEPPQHQVDHAEDKDERRQEEDPDNALFG